MTCVKDVPQTLALVDSTPPVAGRPGHPRRWPEAMLDDKGYESNSTSVRSVRTHFDGIRSA